VDECPFHKGYASGVKERLRVVVEVGAISAVGSVRIISKLLWKEDKLEEQ